MDIWDVVRLLVRRWAVSVPLLLLTLAAAVVMAFNVQPDYVGATHVSLLSPTAQRSAAAGQTLRVNPWDTERLTNAVTVRLNTRSFADQLEAAGVKGVWDAGLDESYRSVIRIEVTSPTAADARSTMARLLREVDDEVARQQAKFPNLTPDDKITTIRLDAGDDVETSTANVKRAVAVVAVAGLLLTTAVSAGVDARRRRRTRRRSDTAGVPATSIDTDATQPVVITNVPLPMPVAGAIPASQFGPVRSLSREQASGSGRSAPSPDDSTIVLPFSNAPWADRQKTAGPGEAEADKAAEVAQR